MATPDSPQHTVQILHYDPALAVMVMEDLSSHRIWRGELISGVYYPQAATQLGEYLAQTLFHTAVRLSHQYARIVSGNPSRGYVAMVPSVTGKDEKPRSFCIQEGQT